MKKVNRLVLYLLAPTTLLRFACGWLGMALCSLGIFIVSLLGGDPHKGTGAFFVRNFCKWAARNTILMMSGTSIKERRPNVDYKKYLGEDWKKTYENPGTIVSNHQCWLDIMMHMYR